jgi:uncharacterized membrane protein
MLECHHSGDPMSVTQIPHIIHPFVTIDAPARAVFDVLSDLRRMPEWSIHFCRAIEVDRLDPNDSTVQSPGGPVYFGIRPHAETGVIDWFSGPTKEKAVRWPARVVDIGPAASLFTITALLDDAHPPEAVAHLFQEELEQLKQIVERDAASA